MQNPNRKFLQPLCPSIYHFNLNHEHYDSGPHNSGAYVQKPRENLTKMSKKRGRKRKKAFKIVFKALLTSTTPKHALTAPTFITFFKTLSACVKAKQATKNMCMWRQLKGKNFELAHQSADDGKISSHKGNIARCEMCLFRREMINSFCSTNAHSKLRCHLTPLHTVVSISVFSFPCKPWAHFSRFNRFCFSLKLNET